MQATYSTSTASIQVKSSAGLEFLKFSSTIYVDMDSEWVYGIKKSATFIFYRIQHRMQLLFYIKQYGSK